MATLIHWWWVAPALIVGVAMSVSFAATHNRDQRFVAAYIETLFSIILALTLLLVAAILLAWTSSTTFSVFNYTMVRVGGLPYFFELVKTSIEHCRDNHTAVDCGLPGSLLIALVGACQLTVTIAAAVVLLIVDLFARCCMAQE